MKRLPILLILPLMIIAACGGGRSTLDEADLLLDALPDSALILLESVDAEELHDDEQAARLSLLLTMARLKTDPFTVSDSIFKAAYDYYGERTESNRETMITHFIQAAMWMMRDSTVKAIDEWENTISKAEGLNKDLYIGKSYLNIGSKLLDFGSVAQAKAHIEAAMPYIISSKDTTAIINCHMLIGMCLNSIGKAEDAESEYAEALKLSKAVCDNKLVMLSECHLAYSSAMNGRYNEAVRMYDALIRKRMALRKEDIFAYSLSLSKTGRIEDAEKTIRSFEGSVDYDDNARYYFVMSLLKESQGLDREALTMRDSLEKYRRLARLRDSGSMIDKNRIADMNSAYDLAESTQTRLYQRNDELTIILIIMSFLPLLWLIVNSTYRRFRNNGIDSHERSESDMSQNIATVKEELRQRLETTARLENKIESLMNHRKQLLSENMDLKKTISRLSRTNEEYHKDLERIRQLGEVRDSVRTEIAEIEKELDPMRSEMKRNFMSYHGKISDICNTPPEGKDIKEYDMKLEKLLLPYRDDDYLNKLRRHIDFFTGGLLSDLEDRLKLSDRQIKTAIYDICGFDYVRIGLLFNKDASNGGVSRSRLKKKLESLDSEMMARCREYFNLWK